MNQRAAIFAAALERAELVEEPELVEDEGQTWWQAQALLGPWQARFPTTVYILPLCPGWDLPYHKGDIVRVVHAQEIAIVVGVHANALDHEGHTRLGPRPDTGKDLRLGPSTGGGWEAVALHSRMAAEIVSLKEQIDALVSTAQSLVMPPEVQAFGSAAEVAVAAATLAGGITGGDPASRVMARKA